MRYYGRKVLKPTRARRPNGTTVLMQMLVGDRKMPGKCEIASMAIRSKAKKLGRACAAPFRKREESGVGQILKPAFLDSIRRLLPDQPDLKQALVNGLPPLGEHQQMFEVVSQINRDVADAITRAIDEAISEA